MRHLYEYMEFDNLSQEAKNLAIDNVREKKYEGKYGGDDVGEWIVDADALFEPPSQEMEDLFGEDYYEANGNQFMIENTRENISFIGKQDPNYYIHCAHAMEVTNDNLFLRWLGIPPKFHPYIYYSFRSSGNKNTFIEFEIDDLESMIEAYSEEYEEDVVEILLGFFDRAEKKFEKHIDRVLTLISDSIDEEFSDDGIIDTIESNDIRFEEDGSIFQN